jgi:hypothetical protein
MNFNSSRSYFGRRLDPDGHNPQYPFRGIRTERYTFAVYPDGDWVLFDNEKDPYQMDNLVNDPAYTELKERLRARLEQILAESEYPFILDEWKSLPLAEMIHVEDEYYTVVKRAGRLDEYRTEALEPYLARAETADQKKRLERIAEEVYDYAFFGMYLALERVINSASDGDKLRARLEAHEAEHRKAFDRRAEEIL